MTHRPLLSVDMAKERARGRVPKSVYQYLEGGTEGEITTSANEEAFRQVSFLPHAAVLDHTRELATTVLGMELSMPVILAPTGLVRLAHRQGEIIAARVAGELGTVSAVSTMAGYSIEQITAAATGPIWYQIYFAGGRPAVEVAIERAKRTGCRALVVTVDQAVHAGREKMMAGRGIPQKFSLRTAIEWFPEVIGHPRWLLNFLRDGLALELPNVRQSIDGPSLSIQEAGMSMHNCAPTWADLAWIREQWGGPVVVKGLVAPNDARRAIDAGADAIVVSNHGGNALDGTIPTLRALPAVVDAVDGKVEVLMDGGVRRAGDVVKALALGARAVLMGRGYLWPLAADGERGLREVMTGLRDKIDGTLALLGCPSVHELDRSYLDIPPDWLVK